MAVVRYVTLLALVVWLGVMQSVVFADRPQYAEWLPYACGGLMMVGLFAMKFVGPPPRAFVPRVAIVLLMLCVAAFDQFYGSSIVPTAMNAALALVLLGWYAHE
jgi:hypothetical protein